MLALDQGEQRFLLRRIGVEPDVLHPLEEEGEDLGGVFGAAGRDAGGECGAG